MRRVSLLLALLAALVLGGAVAAQDGTAIVLPDGLPVTPDPSECTVEARSIDDLLAEYGATPVAATPSVGEAASPAASPATGPAAFTLPAGEPADGPAVEAITATLRELLACANTGNFLVFFEFITEDLAEEFTAEPISQEEVDFLRGTLPALPPEQYGTLVDVREATLLPDGRVGALVDTIFPEEGPGVQTDWFVFEEVDGRWLIDEIVEDLEGQYPPTETATPAA